MNKNKKTQLGKIKGYKKKKKKRFVFLATTGFLFSYFP